jgi:hypothetical protein
MDTRELVKRALPKSNGKHSYSEGEVAKSIEKETAQMPSDIFLWTALGCLGFSAVFRLVGLRSFGQFVGQAAAPILIMGLYNKIVKLEGHDRTDTGS